MGMKKIMFSGLYRLLRLGVYAMNMSKYMTFTVELERLIGENEDTMMPEYADPIEIKCFIYGKDIFIREGTSATTVSAKVYLTLECISVGDKLDGQVIKSTNNYPESWDSRVQLFEALTWYD